MCFSRISASTISANALRRCDSSGRRPGDPTTEVVGRLGEPRAVDVRHPQVEEREWMLGPLGQLQFEHPQVAPQLPLLPDATLIRTRVDDIQLAPGHFAPGPSAGTAPSNRASGRLRYNLTTQGRMLSRQAGRASEPSRVRSCRARAAVSYTPAATLLRPPRSPRTASARRRPAWASRPRRPGPPTSP